MTVKTQYKQVTAEAHRIDVNPLFSSLILPLVLFIPLNVFAWTAILLHVIMCGNCQNNIQLYNRTGTTNRKVYS
jgi:hypothetical protein